MTLIFEVGQFWHTIFAYEMHIYFHIGHSLCNAQPKMVYDVKWGSNQKSNRYTDKINIQDLHPDRSIGPLDPSSITYVCVDFGHIWVRERVTSKLNKPIDTRN